MRIKSIELENNDILGNLVLDFTDNNGAIVDTVILAGENGCGKTTILDIIYAFSILDIASPVKNEKRVFQVEFTEEEINTFISFPDVSARYKQITKDLSFKFDYSKRINNYERLTVTYNNDKGDNPIPSSYFFQLKHMFKSTYSNVQVNYLSKQIKTVTSEQMDATINGSIKSSEDIATKIKQALIDIDTEDARELNNWTRANPNKPVPQDIQQRRMKRFTIAFSKIFEKLNFSRVTVIDEVQEVLFQNDKYEIPINSLSSGEKQIVFRAGEILKNQHSLQGCFFLIDEPEISLHPKWQEKIVDFYKLLFTDGGRQLSQIFAATHSPFIVHNNLRKNDKVIVLKKNVDGKILCLDKPEYYKCNGIEAVQEAFNTLTILHDSPIVYLEGRTDERYFKKAAEVYGFTNLPFEFRWIGYIDSRGQEANTGKDALNKAVQFLISKDSLAKSVCLYDCDVSRFEEDRKNVYIRVIPFYENSKKMRKGIENALVFDDIDLTPFYSKKIKEGDYGDDNTITEFDKMACCDTVCSMDSKELLLVFSNIKLEIEKLLKIFV